MLVSKILIIEFTQPIDTSRTSAIPILEITTLAHEILDLRIMLDLDWRKKELGNEKHTIRWNLLPLYP